MSRPDIELYCMLSRFETEGWVLNVSSREIRIGYPEAVREALGLTDRAGWVAHSLLEAVSSIRGACEMWAVVGMRDRRSREAGLSSNLHHDMVRRVIGGCVRDVVNTHPDYFTDRGLDKIAGSLEKRLFGQLAALGREQGRPRTAGQGAGEITGPSTREDRPVGDPPESFAPLPDDERRWDDIMEAVTGESR